MSATSTPAGHPVAPKRIAAASRQWAGGAGLSVIFAAVTLVMALAAAHEIADGDTRLGAGIAALPLLLWLLARPATAIVALGGSIPILDSLTGGNAASTGYQAAPSDVLIVVLTISIAAQLAARAAHLLGGKPIPIGTAFRPIARPVLQFGVAMIILLVFHFGIRDLAKTGQRYELFLLPIIIGAYAVIIGQHYRVLKAYVVVSAVLAVIWPIDNLEMNKNPVGQILVNAVILVIGVPRLRHLQPCLVLLIPGLILTESRGAIVAGMLGIGAMLVFRRADAGRLLRRIVPVIVVAGLAFAVAPADIQQRLTSFSSANFNSGQQVTGAQYSVSIRQQYLTQAEAIISANRWIGVGVGNYYNASTVYAATSEYGATDDPHDVLLLTAAEGGYIFLASFLIMIGGVLVALRRMREADIAAAAFGVFVATFTHGLVDVYWVRGTPDLSWLLVGMTCAMWMGLYNDPVAGTIP